jgi:hypothetical protein
MLAIKLQVKTKIDLLLGALANPKVVKRFMPFWEKDPLMRYYACI